MMKVVPRPGRALHADLAGMFLDDAVGHRQSQPGSPGVAGLGLVLGGEEWIVDAMDVFLRNPVPVSVTRT